MDSLKRTILFLVVTILINSSGKVYRMEVDYSL